MSKERLNELEATGEYVFHGSPNGEIEILEPRQSTRVSDPSKPSESIADGNPAVSATPYADLATFRAIINKQNIPLEEFSSGFGIDNAEKRTFQVSSAEVLDHVKDKKGYVYVLIKTSLSRIAETARTARSIWNGDLMNQSSQ